MSSTDGYPLGRIFAFGARHPIRKDSLVTEITATRAAALTSSIGVNLHLYSPPGSYGNPALVARDTNYLGINLARSPAANLVWAAQHGATPEEATLAAEGIKF